LLKKDSGYGYWLFMEGRAGGKSLITRYAAPVAAGRLSIIDYFV